MFKDTYLEQNPASEKLSKDAANGPDVDGVGVVLRAQQDLRGAVVLSHNLLGHRLARVLLLHPATRLDYFLESRKILVKHFPPPNFDKSRA